MRKIGNILVVLFVFVVADVCAEPLLDLDLYGSAYEIKEISEDEYRADASGKAFKVYVARSDHKLVPVYYRYQSVPHIYNDTVSKTESGEGDGSVEVEGTIAEVNIGLGVNNSGNIEKIDNVLYQNNNYSYNYTGDGATVILKGGVIYNEGVIGKENDDGKFEGEAITADFVGNKVSSAEEVWIEGGVLNNKGKIGLIKSDFLNNSAQSGVVEGVNIYNDKRGAIQKLHSDFLGNKGEGVSAKGGAVFNMGRIDEINGGFVNNLVLAQTQANGGALHNNDKAGQIDTIIGSFLENKAVSNFQAWGGAIDNYKGTIENIVGSFNNNSATGLGNGSGAFGGAISNAGEMKLIEGRFLGNTARAKESAFGGAIYNDTSLKKVSGLFIGNKATSDVSAKGGAIYHEGGELLVSNASFYDNSVVSKNEAKGGAIYADNLKIAANGANSVFSGNMANDESNALYMERGGKLTLEAAKGGNIVFDDGIDGEAYDVTMSGDGSGTVILNNKMDNVREFVLGDKSSLRLGQNAGIRAVSYQSNGDNNLIIDVEVDRKNDTVHNGVIHIDGDVNGETKVVVNSKNLQKLKDMKNAVSVFLEAPNDGVKNDEAFSVSRVIGSPYVWDAFRNYKGEEAGSTWYLAVTQDLNKYTPEIPAYLAMQSAAMEQNRGIGQKVSEGLRANRCRGCCDKRLPYYQDTWVNVDYENADIDAPSQMDAKIKGVTGGFDLAADYYHKVGLFGAYRQGDYDISGKGKYRSDTGSSMDIDSYLGGLYYRYGRYHWTVLATAFGGKQDISMKTDDHSVFVDTSASQFGGSLDISRQFFLPYAWLLEPSLGLYYTALDMDGFSDNMGQKVDFDLMHYMEAELGLRIEHLFCANDGQTAKVYIKPSVIQTYAMGDKTNISTLSSINTYKNQTLGKMEIGAKFGLAPRVSAYTSAHYTFGSDYKAYGVDAGLTYSW